MGKKCAFPVHLLVEIFQSPLRKLVTPCIYWLVERELIQKRQLLKILNYY